jgi:mercuric ion transport protein
MNDRSLIATGAIGAAICCATPILAIGLGAAGLTAWLAKADYILIPALLIFLGLAVYGIYRRRAVDTCSVPETNKQDMT